MQIFNEIQCSYKKRINPSIKIKSAEDAEEYLRPLFTEIMDLKEMFVIVLLNRNANLIGHYEVSTGGISGTVVDPKIIFAIALKCLASAVLLCHNHPSGQLKVSDQDLSLTKKLREGGKYLDISIHDHIIITADGFMSF